MSHAKVIIGANYGDEGKGLATDYFSGRSAGPATVIRFNGGAQAGHTVVTPDGQRHVFSHFGSGTLAGAGTFLGPRFVSHPMLFLEEWRRLVDLGARPRAAADPDGLVTTPFDMMINQALELSRGVARHGSCGIGFGETLEREEYGGIRLRLTDLAHPARTRRILRRIQNDYLPGRLARLGLVADGRFPFFDSAIIERFMEDCAAMLARLRIRPVETLARSGGLIFEGAQGLMLDRDLGDFPHVTRSNTGLGNVVPLAERLGLTELEVVYMTRAYQTRHGAGPLAHELPGKPYARIVDATNIPNPFQGSLRFAWLDPWAMRRIMDADLAMADVPKELAIRRALAVTCLDQVNGLDQVNSLDQVDGAFHLAGPDGRIRRHDQPGFLDTLRVMTGAQRVYTSHGPTRASFGAARQSRPDYRMSGMWGATCSGINPNARGSSSRTCSVL